MPEFRRILSLLRRSPCVESLQCILATGETVRPPNSRHRVLVLPRVVGRWILRSAKNSLNRFAAVQASIISSDSYLLSAVPLRRAVSLLRSARVCTLPPVKYDQSPPIVRHFEAGEGDPCPVLPPRAGCDFAQCLGIRQPHQKVPPRRPLMPLPERPKRSLAKQPLTSAHRRHWQPKHPTTQERAMSCRQRPT